MPEWGMLPPEENSAGFWFGPGASSFLQSAAQLLEVAAAMIANLGGHEAVAAALAAAWPDPTGEFAVLANVPHLLWQARLAGMLMDAAARIEATGSAFETLKAATPTPFEVGENQTEHVALQAHNFLGMLTPAIVANRANYSRMWVTAAGNKYSYAAASASGVQAIPPLDPPPPTTVAGGGNPTSAMGRSSQNPADSLASSGPEMAMQFMQPLTQVGSQFGQLAGGGGPTQGLTQVISPLQSLMSSMGAMGNPASSLSGANSADWLTATPAAGGPVAANMVSGGGSAGVGGLGGLRGPVGWASSPTVNAAAPDSAEAANVSRVAEAKAATGAPANSAGMGGTGGMMGPMAHGAGEQSKEEAKQRKTSPLTSLAALYRAPAGVPVITGSGGAVFHREEVGANA
ncbi:PPE family protein [Mycobacterium riyadhense]|uniref:Putative PPE family protein PPE29 n=1 Tax=Mycobacterium riyadhense TaxID=486698 RepID=A0A653EUB6_9MYCO|nr:PPE family protein [Mycobacterium riyadhense]VTP00968.1 putative PPE family protein PPE29 [Mycobacterium riyadhense]